MTPRGNRAGLHYFRLIMDIIVIYLAFFSAQIFLGYFINSNISTFELWMPVIFFPLFIFSMYYNEMYNRSTFLYSDRTIRNLSFSFLMATLSIVLVVPFISKHEYLIRDLLFFLSVTYIELLFLWLVIHRWLGKSQSAYRTHAIIVGQKGMIESYLYYHGKSSYNANIIGYILTDPGTEEHFSVRNLGLLENFKDILAHNVVDEVIFTFSSSCTIGLDTYVSMCEERGLTVRFALDIFPMRISKSYVHHVGTIPVLTYYTVSLNYGQLFIKRFMDIIGATIGLVITGIASLFIIPAIKLSSEGPILFKQKRVGLNGRVFELYKFRTMVTNAEALKAGLMKHNEIKSGLMFKIENDPRITKFGAFLRKTSLDELPQFINILKNEMSLVGTRPPTVDEVSRYNNSHHRRISIKPGLTGNWQVSGRSKIKDFDEVVKLDTLYIDDWSIWKDIAILIKTIFVLFDRRDAF